MVDMHRMKRDWFLLDAVQIAVILSNRRRVHQAFQAGLYEELDLFFHVRKPIMLGDLPARLIYTLVGNLFMHQSSHSFPFRQGPTTAIVCQMVSCIEVRPIAHTSEGDLSLTVLYFSRQFGLDFAPLVV